MATIVLSIVVDRLDEVVANYDRIKVYRSTTGINGPFPELTTPATRIVLVPTQAGYQFTDNAGDNDYWYQISYFNSTTLLESSRTDAVQGESEPALDVITVDELKTLYLFGVNLTNDDGTPYPDSIYEHYIRSAIDWVETRCDIAITKRVITDERYDFIKQDYYKYIWLSLRTVPVISVDEISLVLPTNQNVITYDPSWINLRKESGQVNIVPGNGQLSTVLLGQTGAWLPLAYGWTDFIPDVFRVNYTVGFEKGKVPPLIKHAVGMYAALGPFNIAGDLIAGAGIAASSLSLDGLSQSISTTSSATNAGYGARIIQYQKDLKEILPQIRRAYHPTPAMVAV